MRRRRLVAALFVSMFVAGALCCGSSVGLFEPYRTWYAADAVQVLGDSERLIVFLEVRQYVLYPGWARSAPVRSVGQKQYCFIADEEGIEQRIEVSPENGITFHPNISYIFSYGGRIYLLQGESLGYEASVYRWTRSRFVLLSEAEGKMILSSCGLDETNRLFESSPQPDELQPLFQNRAPFWASGETYPFQWKGIDLAIKSEPRAEKTMVTLECQYPDRPWSTLLARYDHRWTEISTVKLEELESRMQRYGHRK